MYSFRHVEVIWRLKSTTWMTPQARLKALTGSMSQLVATARRGIYAANVKINLDDIVWEIECKHNGRWNDCGAGIPSAFRYSLAVRLNSIRAYLTPSLSAISATCLFACTVSTNGKVRYSYVIGMVWYFMSRVCR